MDVRSRRAFLVHANTRKDSYRYVEITQSTTPIADDNWRLINATGVGQRATSPHRQIQSEATDGRRRRASDRPAAAN
jgi:hypothetical protein